ncbi:hypothetical protein SEA_DMITRI_51 [Gordonia phage Dmitri]|nr:hypothetical protein SEA_DMITRI_51 [Gordonia phage Dmitri]
MRSSSTWTRTSGGLGSRRSADARSTDGSSSTLTVTPRRRASDPCSRISVPPALALRVAAMVLVLAAMVAAVALAASPTERPSDTGRAVPSPVEWTQVCR